MKLAALGSTDHALPIPSTDIIRSIRWWVCISIVASPTKTRAIVDLCKIIGSIASTTDKHSRTISRILTHIIVDIHHFHLSASVFNWFFIVCFNISSFYTESRILNIYCAFVAFSWAYTWICWAVYCYCDLVKALVNLLYHYVYLSFNSVCFCFQGLLPYQICFVPSISAVSALPHFYCSYS